MNNVKILVITTLLTLSLSSCLKNNEEATEETSTNEQGEMISRFVTQDVEVFDLLEEEDFVRFRRNGDVTADTSVSISPEISGKITDIKAAIKKQHFPDISRTKKLIGASPGKCRRSL